MAELQFWEGKAFGQWIHHTTSALVVAAVVFIAGNWYNTGNNVAAMAVELKGIQVELARNNDIAMAALNSLSREIHLLQEVQSKHGERLSALEAQLQWFINRGEGLTR